MNLNENQKEMAKKLGVTAAYLSAVEKDKNNIPGDWYEKLIIIYNLSQKEIRELNKSIIGSRKNISVEELSSEDRNLIFTLVQYLSNENENDKDNIRTVIKKLTKT